MFCAGAAPDATVDPSRSTTPMPDICKAVSNADTAPIPPPNTCVASAFAATDGSSASVGTVAGSTGAGSSARSGVVPAMNAAGSMDAVVVLAASVWGGAPLLVAGGEGLLSAVAESVGCVWSPAVSLAAVEDIGALTGPAPSGEADDEHDPARTETVIPSTRAARSCMIAETSSS